MNIFQNAFYIIQIDENSLATGRVVNEWWIQFIDGHKMLPLRQLRKSFCNPLMKKLKQCDLKSLQYIAKHAQNYGIFKFNGINSVRAMYVVKKEFNFNESTLKNGQLTAWRIKGLSACKSDPFG